jgi:transcriptional regulator with XRE-family HTH domain
MNAAISNAPDYAANLRRIMTRQGWSLAELVLASGLDERTIRGILQGSNRPHIRTLHRLAEALGVGTDEFFQTPAVLTHRLFDRATNPLVEEVIQAEPELFANWTEAEFDSLYSRFGTGGALTREGARLAATQINQQRQILSKVALLLETQEADILIPLVETLYRRVCVVEDQVVE